MSQMFGNGSPPQMGSPTLSNSISSMGSPQATPESQKPNPQQDQASNLINRFGVIFQDLQTLQSDIPGGDTEFNLVKDALKNWLAAKSDGITNSGGESATY